MEALIQKLGITKDEAKRLENVIGLGRILEYSDHVGYDCYGEYGDGGHADDYNDIGSYANYDMDRYKNKIDLRGNLLIKRI